MFRFEDLEIWKDAIRIADEFFDIADRLEGKKLFRFAEQIRGAALSISNNIAEGSGSFSNKDFANYLSIARKSSFECANVLIIINRRNLVEDSLRHRLLDDLESLARKITNFRKTLLKL